MSHPAWPNRLGNTSFWLHDIGKPALRAALPGPVSVDVCIIGAGYTGLWTALYLRRAAPHLRVVVLEAEHAGFGASGRNGGWLTGGFAWNHDRYLAQSSPEAVRAIVQAIQISVAEILAVCKATGIDADIHPTEELMVATNPAQLARLRAEVATRIHWGETGIQTLDASALAQRISIPGAMAAMLVPNVARIQPAKLATALARLVEAEGT